MGEGKAGVRGGKVSITYKDALSPYVQQGGKKKKGEGTKIVESDQVMFANAEDKYFYKGRMSTMSLEGGGGEGWGERG